MAKRPTFPQPLGSSQPNTISSTIYALQFYLGEGKEQMAVWKINQFNYGSRANVCGTNSIMVVVPTYVAANGHAVACADRGCAPQGHLEYPRVVILVSTRPTKAARWRVPIVGVPHKNTSNIRMSCCSDITEQSTAPIRCMMRRRGVARSSYPKVAP